MTVPGLLPTANQGVYVVSSQPIYEGYYMPLETASAADRVPGVHTSSAPRHGPAPTSLARLRPQEILFVGSQCILLGSRPPQHLVLSQELYWGVSDAKLWN